MVDNIASKPLGLVLIATAHMVFNGHSHAKVTGILGGNITLQFRFNNTQIDDQSHVAIYSTGEVKIAECNGCKGGAFDFYPIDNSVLYHITNLTQNQSKTYWASLFHGSGYAKESNKVPLIVQEETRSSTVPPTTTYTAINDSSESSSSLLSHIVTVLVVSPAVLLIAVLPYLIWCLVRTKDKQQPPRQNSYPTVQETIEEFNSVHPPSVVYSVLDFPKRPSAVVEMNPNDTEYAAVSYLPEKRRV